MKPIPARKVRQLVKSVAIPAVVVPLVGMALQWITSAIEGGAVNPLLGILLGAVALALREIVDQLGKAGKAMNGGAKVPRVGDHGTDPARKPHF